MLFRKGVSMQVFSFMFALILIALILAYGVKNISTLIGVGQDVELGDFFFRLRDEANLMASFDVGSSKQMTFFLPKRAEKVCFFNGDREITASGLDRTLELTLETNLGKNVFVMPPVFAENIFFVEDLRAGGEENPLCFATKGKFMAMLETVLEDDGKVYVEVRRPT